MSKQYPNAPDLVIDPSRAYSATLSTSHGEIDISLQPARSPLAVNSFVFLAREGFYDGVIFHRVIPGFVIQAGDPTGTGRGGPGYRFRDELEGRGEYGRGTVAMANAGPNTNGSQFFICLGDLQLPHQYTIFGEVTSGMDTVDTIATTPTGAGDRPHEPPTISSIAISES